MFYLDLVGACGIYCIYEYFAGTASAWATDYEPHFVWASLGSDPSTEGGRG